MTEFNDEILKPKLERFIVRLKQVDNETINAWKLTDLLQGFSSAYYKIDLMHSILKALNNNIHPKNIVLFDRTINYQYNKYEFSKLDLSSDVYNVYRLGHLIPLFPNLGIFELNSIFKLFHDVYGIMKSLEQTLIFHDAESFKTPWLEDYYDLYRSSDFVTTVKKLSADAIKQIPDGANSYKGLIKSIEETTLNNYQIYLKDNTHINYIIKKLQSNKEVNIGYYEKYFNDFFDNFEKNSRPIVAIYDPKNPSFNFLCSYHFNVNTNNSLLFTIDNITHNSPYDIILTVAGWIFSPLISKKINNNKYINEQEKRYKNLQILRMEEEQLSKLYYMIDSLFKQNIEIEYESLKSKYVSNKFIDILNSIKIRFSELFEAYSFDIIDIQKI